MTVPSMLRKFSAKITSSESNLFKIHDNSETWKFIINSTPNCWIGFVWWPNTENLEKKSVSDQEYSSSPVKKL